MKILIWSQYFWPENFIINNLVTLLKDEGVSVTVLTGQPNYPIGKTYKGYNFWQYTHESYNEIEIFRVPLIPRGKNSKIRLTLNYLSFIISAKIFAPWLLRKKKFDLVFVYAPSPLLQTLPAINFASRNKIPLAVWVQDLWPESLLSTGHVKNTWILSMVSWLVRSIYQAASLILVQSRAFIEPIEILTDNPSKIHYYPNFYQQPTAIKNRKSTLNLVKNMKNHFCVVFTGNLGTAQALDTILDAAHHLSKYPLIRIILVGSGSLDQWITAQIDKYEIDNLILAGHVDASDIPLVFEAAQALLVTLKNDPALALTIPSKVQAYLASGKPLIGSLDGESARIIQESGAGFCSPAGDSYALATSIIKLSSLSESERQLMGQRGRTYFENHFSPTVLTKQLLKHFSQLISKKEHIT